MDQEHEESWRMRIYNKLLTARDKFVLLVVNSIKLHLTAYKDYDPFCSLTWVNSKFSVKIYTPSELEILNKKFPAWPLTVLRGAQVKSDSDKVVCNILYNITSHKHKPRYNV